jgi:PAS domain S-box-containing protein
MKSIATAFHDPKYARSLIEASLDFLVTINTEGEITDVNEALVKVTGVPRQQLIGTNFSTYFTDAKKASQGYLKAFEKGFVANYPLTMKRAKGKFMDVRFNASVYKDDAGHVLGVFASARDITDKKWAKDLQLANKELAYQNNEKEKRAAELVVANQELRFQNNEKEKRAAELVIANQELRFQNEEKEKRAAELIIANKELGFQNNEKEKRAIESKELEAVRDSLKRASQYTLSLIEASRDPLFTISKDGKIMDTNLASVKATGVPRDELIGTNFYSYFTEPDKAKEGYLLIFEKGFVTDYPLTIKDHVLTEVLFNGSVYKDEHGNVLGAVVVARDITDLKRNEKELIEAKIFAEMATEIAVDAKAVAENAAELSREAVKAKQQFLSNMSHEIRTPMNAIIGFTKVLIKTDISEKQKEYLNAIKTSGDALIVLINDILDLAKVDSGKMTFEVIPFNLKSSISAMLHVFETKFLEKNLELEYIFDDKIPDTLLGDPVRLHQIILNLVSNAVKFTHKGKVVVSVKSVADTDQQVTVQFTVTDTGIGIAGKKLEQIFENFQQASSNTSRIFGGTGLGLAIVKQLVEGQGGEIQVESELNKGSSFSFYLNFAKTDLQSELHSNQLIIDKEIKKIRVLVVEDIALNQLLIKTLLDDFGFERDIASNGKIAIEMLKNKSYDIILMDLQMPEMNGFEATEYIRNTLHSTIPIMALTADVTTADLAKCTSVGMNDYVSKPIDEKILYNKIIGLVRKPSAVQAKLLDNDVLVVNKKKFTDLTYLRERTKSNINLMLEMLEAYLEQTPALITALTKSFKDEDWEILQATAHKIIPSFSIIGMSSEFETIARNVQEYAVSRQKLEGIQEMVNQLEHGCMQACEELTEEYQTLKNHLQ